MSKDVSAIVSELGELHSVLDGAQRGPKGTQHRSAIQHVPWWRRRKAATHNYKRLPSRLWDRARKQKLDKVQVKKRKRSKYRVKMKDKLRDYTGRQLLFENQPSDEHCGSRQKPVWLESHIWHSKRFHMRTQWGVKLPWKPTQKCNRTLLRAVNRHCTIQDLSYLQCVELYGNYGVLIDGLKHCLSKNAAISSDCNEVQVLSLYEHDKYPFGYISDVEVIWKPVDGEVSDGLHHLWMWSHPAATDTIIQQLQLVYQLVPTDDDRKRQDLLQKVIIPRKRKRKQQAMNKQQQKLTKKRKKQKSVCEPSSGENNSGIAVRVDDAASTTSDGRADGKHNETRDSTVLDNKDSGASLEDSSKGKGVVSTESSVRASVKDGEKCDSKLSSVKVEDQLKLKILSKDDLKLVRFASIRRYTSSGCDAGHVGLVVMKGVFNRIRLRGPTSTRLLSHVLRPASVQSLSAESNKRNGWCKEYYKSQDTRRCQQTHSQTFAGMLHRSDASNSDVSPDESRQQGELDDGHILSVTVQDHRRFINPVPRMPPPAQAKSDTTAPAASHLDDSAPPHSPLWSVDIHRDVAVNRVTDQYFKQYQHEKDLSTRMESYIPVILIYNRGCHSKLGYHGIKSGYGSGWDVILPANWSMSLWLALIYATARPGGLHHTNDIHLEMGCGRYPEDAIDSVYYTTEGKEAMKQELESKYYARPKSKRVNYDKLGVDSPFAPDWSAVVSACDKGNGAAGGDEKYFVVRDAAVIRDIVNMCREAVNSEKSGAPPPPVPHSLLPAGGGYVMVRVEMYLRGVCDPLALICIPSPHDLTALTQDRQYTPMAAAAGKGIPHSEQRAIIGHITNGKHSFSIGRGIGVGFVAVSGLTELLQSRRHNNQTSQHRIKCPLVCLVRNTNTLQYRFAVFRVLQ